MSEFPAVRRLHHFAYRCKNAEETRHFYEDIIGLPLMHVIRSENVPSTGENSPHLHIFFELKDGSALAFFDLGDDQAAAPSANTASWVNHVALKVDSPEDVRAAQERLTAAGVDVLGPVDHNGFVYSIYFFDPNGIRVEFTADTEDPSQLAIARSQARGKLDQWTREMREAKSTSTAA